jgi:hypothetical protein
MGVKLRPLCQGEALTVFVVEDMCDYSFGLTEQVQKKLINRVKMLGDFGFIRNETQFKKIKSSRCDNLYEIILLSEQLRFFCYFMPKDKVVVFDSIVKKKDRLPQSVYERICKKMLDLNLN